MNCWEKLPEEIQNKIVKMNRHPLAQLITNHLAPHYDYYEPKSKTKRYCEWRATCLRLHLIYIDDDMQF